MTEALRWLPDAPEVYLQRAAWRLEDGQHDQALKDVKEAESRAHESVVILTTKAQILQHLGRHAEAISIWKNIDRISKTRGVPERSMALNGLAYARAVGRMDVKEALEDAAEALQQEPGNAAILDTHAFLLHLDGQNEEAIKELDDAVQGMEQELSQIQSVDAKRYRQQQMRFTGGIDLSGINKPQTGVAVVRYHRALVLKALGREEDAKKDLERARELIGREPDDQLF